MKNMEELLKKDLQLNRTLDGREGCLVRRDMDIPLVVVGDLHGEVEGFRSIRDKVEELNLVSRWGHPNWVFLGDYVDRGPDSLVLLEHLLTFHLNNRDRVILLRGNHEDWRMNLNYGFARELHSRAENGLQDLVREWYESLPLIALISPFAMVHGGPPFPLPVSLEEMVNITFFDSRGSHMVWSDPLDEYYINRGAGSRAFNKGECGAFLKFLDCSFLIRGHQYVPFKGYKINFGNCITLFSAAYGQGWPRSFLYSEPLSNITDVEKQIFTV